MPGMMSTAELATLRTAEGTAFDRQFATMMIAHHLGAIEMARSELTAGADADARALAEQIILTQQSEVDVLRGITARL